MLKIRFDVDDSSLRDSFLGTVSSVYWNLHLLRTLACRTDDRVWLVSEFGRESTMSFEDLTWAENFLSVTGGMGRNLSGFLAAVTNLLEMLANLLAARAGCIQIFLGITFDLRCPATASLNFIAKVPQTVRQFGLVYGGRKLLGLKEAAGL